MCMGVLPARVSDWGCQIPWNWSHRPFWAVTCMPGIEPRVFGRTTSTPNLWAISLQPSPQILSVLATKCMNHRNLLVHITLTSDPSCKCTYTMSTKWGICVILVFSADTKGMRYNRQDLLLGLGGRGQPRSYPPSFFVKGSPWCLELSD